MSEIGRYFCEWGDFEDGGFDISTYLLLRYKDQVWFEAMSILSGYRPGGFRVRGHR